MFLWIALAFFGMILIGMPIAFALGITGLIGLMLTMGTSLLMLVPQQIFSGMNSFVLMAIPLFLLSGELMNVSGITERIVAFTNTLVGHRKGGLGHVNIVANIFMAGISGAAVADAAALGTMLIPAMGRSGYSRPYSSALTAAASIIGPTIPPSMAMIVYGSVANTSIAGLFATGFLPGLLMGSLYMILNHRISSARGYQMQAEKASRAEVIKAMKDGIFALFMPIIILGGILSGIVTPTEAAGVAVGYALFVGLFIFRTLTPRNIWEALKNTVAISGVSLLLVSVGGILSWVLTVAQIPQTIASTILGITTNKYFFLLLVCILLLIVGCFMDLTASIIILTPILAPIAAQLGIHPLHFGITVVLALNIGLNTPPVGAVLFVVASIGKVPMESMLKEIWPFLICQIVALAVVAFIPWFSLAVPALLGLY
jgi:tripartite ATP-independent transporter DctM subunit